MVVPLPAVVLLTGAAAAWAGVLQVPKCCPIGQVLHKGECVHAGRNPVVQVVNSSLHPVNREYAFVWKPLPCTGGRAHHENYSIFENGSLYRGPKYPVRDDYCIEEVTKLGGAFPLMCPPSEMQYMLNSIGYVISLPFAIATLIVYCMLKELNTVNGKIVMCNMSAFIVCCILLPLTGTRIISPGDILCPYAGYAIQFFFMATFFWLNVMCFDIYWAFSGLKNLTGSVKERERKKLILYSCYAWGLPLLILLITIGIDYSPYVPHDSFFKPGVGVDKCFFQKDGATGLYFYMPMGFVLVINIILFSITAYRICTLRRETAVLKRGDSRKHDNTNDKESVSGQQTNFLESNRRSSSSADLMTEKRKEPYIVKKIRFSLYLKLFLVMGINWAMELISFLAGGPGYIWYIPDFTNTLQGVFIFIIFVWKKRVRRLIWAKITGCCGKSTISSGNRSQWAASSRNTSSLTNSSGLTTNSIKMTPAATNGVATTPETA